MNRLDQDMPRYIADFKAKRYDGLCDLLDTNHPYRHRPLTGCKIQERRPFRPEHYLTVHLPEIMARQYENHNCRLVICFIPSGIRQYSFEGAELQTANRAYDIFNVRQEFPYSVECRVILYAEDGEVVYGEMVR